MKRTKGLSLLEVVIATTLAGILMLVIGRMMGGFSKQFGAANKSSQTKDSLRQLGGHLQKYMGSGDLRFFGFSGRTDRTLARALIPQFGVCGDLSADSKCSKDGAFLYVNYDKLTTPTVSVICALNPAQNPRIWLVDTKMETYGPSVLAPDQKGFQVAAGPSGIFVSGKVTVDANTVLALMNPPAASLWVAAEKPKVREFNQLGNGSFVFPPGGISGITSIDGECLKNFKVASTVPTTLYDLSGVYQVRVDPLSLTQFTGGATSNMTDAVLRAQLTGFPLRVFSADLRSLGKRFVSPENIPVAGLTGCTSVSGTIVCNQPPLLMVHNVGNVRMEQVFKLRLGTSVAERYELIRAASDVSATCKSPRCVPLLLPANNTIPTLITAGESFDALDPSGFSFLKQEAVSRFGFRVSVNNREETYDVIFP